jgi:hypothetical protein
MADKKAGLQKGDRIQVTIVDPETKKQKKETAVFYSFFPDKQTLMVRLEESGKLEKLQIEDCDLPKEAVKETFPNNLNNIKPIDEGNVKEKPVKKEDEEDKKPKISSSEVPRKTKAERVAEMLILGKTNEEIIEVVNCDSSTPGWFRSLMNHELPKNENSQKHKIMKMVMANKTDDEIEKSTGSKRYLIKEVRWGMLIKDVYGTK